MKDSPEITCEICSVDGLWSHHAVSLEGFIKGALKAEFGEIKTNPLWSFEDLRQLVNRAQKLVEGEVQITKNELETKGAMALIDFFSDPKNVDTVLDYYQISGYQLVETSLIEPAPNQFAMVDGYPLPQNSL